MADNQPPPCVQADRQPPEWLPSTCPASHYYWFHYVTTLVHRQSLPMFVGKVLSPRLKRSSEFHATTLVNRSQFTQETAEPCQFSPAELVAYW
jgi:hypothetical protein